MFYVNSKDRERFYFRFLLTHLKGAQSFTELRTIENIVYPSYFETAEAQELVSNDEEWGKCLSEDTQNEFPHAVCSFFAYIFIFLNTHFHHRSLSDEDAKIVALKNIEEIISMDEYSLSDFNLGRKLS